MTTRTDAASENAGVIDRAIKDGNRAFALRHYEDAVQAYSEASRLLGEQYGEAAPECADVLVLYGRALLQNAMEQNGVLGSDGVNKAASVDANQAEHPAAPVLAKLLQFLGEPDIEEDEEDEEEGEEGEEEEGEEDDNQAEDEEEQVEDEEEDEEEDAGPEEDAPMEDAEAPPAAEDGEEPAAEEPDDDFAFAWEMLDLARVIYSRQEGAEIEEKLAEVYMLLGDVSLESENFEQAMKEYCTALDMKKKLYSSDDRRLAEATYYKYALGCEYSNQKDQAIEQLELVSQVLSERITRLRKENEAATVEEDKTAAQPTSENAVEIELADILELRVEVDAKLEELKQSRTSAATAGESAEASTSAAASASTTIAATSEAPVHDISMLVRSSKKPSATTTATDADRAEKRKAEETGQDNTDNAEPDDKRAKA